ncbi:MAG TPA: helix-turn-helix domain-containing protein, partial [Aquificae bacterium]|nr:helix-turn-helix domain-containing protein [Aquificota bacterium]
MASSRLETVKLQLLAVRVLRALKPLYSYRELAKLVGLPPSMLCRYTRGITIPSPEHAKRIVECVPLRRLVRLIWEYKPSILALDNIYELASEIAKNYGTVSFPLLDNCHFPSKNRWLKQVKQLLEEFKPHTVVCHSLANTLWF